MNIQIISKRYIYVLFAFASLISLGSCSTDIVDNGLSDPDVDPAFTITPVDGSAYKFLLTAQPVDVLFSKWDFGDGMFSGKMSETIFLPDAGTYTITHGAVGRGGIQNTTSQDIVIKTPDPIYGNILKGGKLEDAAAWAEWTIANPASNASLVFAPGSVTLTASGYAGQGFYQAVNVVAGKKYIIDMVTSSTTGCTDTWLEVYCGYSVPVQGTDYSDGGKLRAISTWDGCGTAPFGGRISVVGCKPENNKGIFTATTTGVVYLLIRGGGGDMKAGIKIQSIEMRLSL